MTNDPRSAAPRPPRERAADRARRTGSPLTGRAAALAVVVGALVLSSALPMREYVRQHGELQSLRADTAASQQRVAELEAQLQRWKDPSYVETQARQRLQYVMPGEVGYVVLDGGPEPETQDTTLPASSAPQAWYARLWSSVQAADKGPAPAPVATSPLKKATPKPTPTPSKAP